MRIQKYLGNGKYEYEKIPDRYTKSKGFLFRNPKNCLKLYEITAEIETYNTQDFVQFGRLIKLCRLNYRGTQRLRYRYNRFGDLKDVNIEKIMQQLDISRPTARKFLNWCRERDYIRRNETYGTFVVNPKKIMLGARINGIEYLTYKDLLKEFVPPKYAEKLTAEVMGEPQEETEIENDCEFEYNEE